MSTLHPQVMVTAGGLSDEVDEDLAPLLELLWGAGIRTVLSCQSHPPTGKVWIAFESGGDAERFLEAVQSGGPADDWARAEHWYFGIYEATASGRVPPISKPHHPAGWEFYASVHEESGPEDPQFAIHLDLLFPPEDLQHVIARVGASLSRR